MKTKPTTKTAMAINTAKYQLSVALILEIRMTKLPP